MIFCCDIFFYRHQYHSLYIISVDAENMKVHDKL